MARILHGFPPKSQSRVRKAPRARDRAEGRWVSVMNTDNRFFGIVIGCIVAVAAVIFIFSGGELGGKKTVEGDDDLPPIASTGR